ncbi:WcaI family glycosyltransferase [Hydrogenimonas urashimensis]|uniref:WcaI family glycosyltransferase n=1 Tax=Hydrogenimonas urashimensis TaxID=2740515 RepID=UPI001916A5B4|nr:WcaI family glycosyltransferase [Hydrogenimonas urashimensis]
MKKNNITIIGVNFYPEDSSTGLYTTQMAEYLSKKDYEVSVITGFPYYPEWKIRKEYKDKPKYIVETKENITIYRYKQYVPTNPTFKTRTFHLLDFTLGSFFNLFKIEKCDLVISVVPFTSTIFIGKLLSWRKNAKLWAHIQDFEVDAILDSGIASNSTGFKKLLFTLLFGIEKKLLDSADITSTISFSMMEKLKSKTTTPHYYFPNWIDDDFIDPKKAQRHPYLESDRFKILYSGNIGAKQDWDFFLRIVRHFQNHSDIEFIVVGAGAKKEWLVEQTKEIENVIHHMPVEYEELPDLLCSADMHILFQKNDVIDAVMPSKLLGMMGSKKPSVVTGNVASEVATVFKKSNGGLFFDSSDFEGVVEAIKMLSKSPNRRDQMGRNAREYIIEHFAKEKVLKNFEKQIQSLLR